MGRVIFLGTGDLLTWERAQTCLAIPLAGGETMLLDVSSETVLLRQLQEAGIALESIRYLFVSHCHFDHAGGLVPLLTALTALPEASLTVHALPETIRAVHELLALTIPGVEDWLEGRLRWSELTSGRSTLAGDVEVTPFEVDHGIECAGFRISQGGSTLVYAADTRPCQELVHRAKGVDLLVHEAYGPEKDAEQAHTFGHSTAAEAGRVALAAGAKRLILTHIRSSRYILPAELVKEAKTTFGGPVEAARDLDALDFWAAREGVDNELAKLDQEGQRPQDTVALRAYLDQMNRRLLEKDLHYSDADSEVQRLARARTLAMVSNIDTKASRSITRFVADIDLLKGSDSARLLG